LLGLRHRGAAYPLTQNRSRRLGHEMRHAVITMP
jgi:hypothetical protein